ncbi:hypothetical protein OOZ15_17965 [Galbibacter sp. EGI 63066]|uniref:leucine-rich repeat domain-containing protein n=1 Tax=Galbibacter sp. EGI 63066 TaxID=2993559 RepID=UPI002249715D|nr:hypothetical protein [Galbibacter sp. EGI 63066]MCX2681846.1 hypothetical protein [Galbibacter sp. EGI 63066]
MNKIYYLLFFLMVFISCSKDKDSEEINTPEITPKVEGRQAFQIDFAANNSKSQSNKTSDNPKSGFALISIIDTNGDAVLTREKVEVFKQDDKYITDEIILTAGTYSLTEFILTDANNVVVAMVPKANAPLSKLTQNTLPFSFNVKEEELAITSTENISADGYTAVDFGYKSLDLSFPDTTDFFSLIVDESTLITTKTIVIESITNSSYEIDWGDGTTDEYFSDLSNTLEESEQNHTYETKGVYTINISGPLETIQELNFYSNDQENDYQSNLISADISKLSLLNSCLFYAGKLTTLNTSKNTALEQLTLGYNQITNLNFENNLELKNVILRYNQLSNVDISKNSKLELLWLTGNQISGINLFNNTNLEVLSIRENQLNNLDLSKNLSLKRVDLSDNKLKQIDVSNNTNLKEINVGRNLLTNIDLSKNTNLIRVDLYGNQIANIDFSLNTKLKNIYIDDNLLEDIDLSKNPEIDRLIIENNNLTALDITNNPKIFDLEIGGNQFNSTQIDELISLVYDRAVLNSIFDGYINFKNNPGSDDIDVTTTEKINDLMTTYNWSFNNN